MNLRYVLSVIVGFGAVLFLTGCGPNLATITGEVMIDGKPLENGVITFVASEENGGEPATTAIENGKYAIKTLPGKKFVQISAPIVVGRHKESNAPDAKILEATDERLPAQYNSATTLTFDAQAGINTKNWSVESKKR